MEFVLEIPTTRILGTLFNALTLSLMRPVLEKGGFATLFERSVMVYSQKVPDIITLYVPAQRQ